jgi:hypothetical protein
MRIESFACDKCKKVVKKSAELISVGAGRRDYIYGSSYGVASHYTVRQLTADWCLECCISFGIENVTHDQPPPIIPPTIEDMIRELIREELENNK